MIGPKKLSTIREDLRRALVSTGEDPLRWLEEQMTAAPPEGAPAGESEVLHSLQRVLEAPPTRRRQAKRARRK